MEYIYSAMLLNAAGQKIDEASVKKVMTASGAKADDSRIKALVAALDGVNIEEAIAKAAVAPQAAAAPAPSGEAAAAPKEEKKEKPEDKAKTDEEAASGLGALFG